MPKPSDQAPSDDATRAVPDPPDVLDTEEAGGRFIRGGVLRTLSYVTGVLVGVAVTPFMVRHLGVVDFGRFITVTSLMFIVAGLTDVGLNNIGVREYTDRTGESRRVLMRDLLGLRVVLSIVGTAGALVFSVLAGYPTVMVAGTAIAGAALLATNLQVTFTVPLSVELRLGWISGIDMIRQVVTAAAALVLVAVGASLLPFYAIAVVAGATVLFVSAWLVRRIAPFVPSFDPSAWWGLLRDSIPYAVATGLGVVYFRLAVVLMSVLSTDEETGYFSLSFRIIEIVSGIPWLVIFAAFPILTRAAGHDEERFRYALQRLFDVSLLVGVLIAVATILGADFAVEVVGGANFDPAVVPLQLLGVAMIGTFLIATWSYALLSRRRHRELLIANGFAFALGFTLAAVLSGPFGAEGAAVATLTTELALAAFYLVLLGRESRGLLPSPKVIPPTLLAAGLALAVGIVIPGHVVIGATVGTALYLGVLAVLGAIPPEIREALDPRRLRGAA